jgi:hypothetical protein
VFKARRFERRIDLTTEIAPSDGIQVGLYILSDVITAIATDEAAKCASSWNLLY